MLRKLIVAGGVLLALVSCGEDAGTSSRGLVRGPGGPTAAAGACDAAARDSAAGDSAAGDSAGGAGAGGSGSVVPSPDYVIDGAALEGCRSPDEDGCLECCRIDTDPCEYLSGNLNLSGNVYGESGVRDGACAPTCKPCAACLNSTEENLRDKIRELACRSDCDCDTVELIADACIEPDSCACLCGAISADLMACPPAVRVE